MISCVLWNAQSLQSKLSELSEFVEQKNIKIVAITETRGRQNMKFHLPLFHCTKIDRSYGGVALFIHKSLQFRISNHIQSEIGEAIFAEIYINNSSFLFCVTYNSPSCSIDQFKSFFNSVLNKPGSVLVAGDFNAKHTAWYNSSSNRKGSTLLKLCDTFNYQIFPTPEPTHLPANGQTPSFLDFVVAKSIHFIRDVKVHKELSSDHFPVSFKLDTNFESIDLTQFNFKNAKWREFRHELDFKAISIADKFQAFNHKSDIDQCIEMVIDFIHEASSNNIPRRSPFKFRYPFSSEIKQMTIERNSIRNAYQRSGDHNLKREMNRLNRLIKYKANQLYNHSFEQKLSKISHKDNSLYRLGKTLKRKQQLIPPLSLNNETAYSDEKKCEFLAQNFLKAHKTSIDMSSKHDPDVRHSIRCVRRWPVGQVEQVKLKKVIEIIKSLKIKKASGPDDISIRFIRNLPKSFLLILTSIFNKCLKMSYFPKTWKISNIFSISKPGKDSKIPTNYRPISLLSNIGKIFERIILDRMEDFHYENNIIIPNQFGFRKNHSTVQQILRVTERASFGFNQNQTTGMVLLDIEKAFDSVWHDGLIHKLYKLDFPIYLVKIIVSFLKNRKAYVSINKAKSDLFDIPAGVPQGSLLSPLIFNIFINDITIPMNCDIAIYADDTAIICQAPWYNATLLKSRLEIALSEISEFFNDWKIKINSSKTEFIFFTKSTLMRRALSENIKPTFMGETFEWKETVRYLGVHLDSRLNFQKHIQISLKSANRMIAILFCMFRKNNSVRVDVKAMIYRAYLRPIFMYACPVFSNISNSQILKIQRFQNKCLRMILSVPIYTRITDLHEQTRIPLISDYMEKLTKQFYDRSRTNDNDLVNQLGDYSRNSLEFRIRHKLPKRLS